MNEKLLTVILPVFNSEKFIEEAINSILSSSYDNFTLFVIENGSFDNTKQILKKINNVKIKVINLEKNDLIEAYNYGIKLSETKYTAFMDSDDICNSSRFQKQIEFLESNPDHVLVGTSIEYFINKNKTWKIKLPEFYEEINIGFRNMQHSLFNPTIMFRTDIANKAGLFSYTDFPVPDLGFYFRMNKFGKYANISSVYQLFRLSDSSFTSKNFSEIIEKQIELINENFNNKVTLKSLVIMIKKISQKSYISGLKYFLLNRKFCALTNFIVAAIFQPIKAINYFKNKIYLR